MKNAVAVAWGVTVIACGGTVTEQPATMGLDADAVGMVHVMLTTHSDEHVRTGLRTLSFEKCGRPTVTGDCEHWPIDHVGCNDDPPKIPEYHLDDGSQALTIDSTMGGDTTLSNDGAIRVSWDAAPIASFRPWMALEPSTRGMRTALPHRCS